MTAKIQKKRQRYIISRIDRGQVQYARKTVSPAGRLYALLTVLAAAGVFIGAYTFSLYADRTSEAQKLCGYMTSGGFGTAFADSIICLAAIIVICFFCGFSSAGQPFGYIICILKGMGAGYISACVFSEGLEGINAQAAAALPFQIMGTAIVILAARENIRMSAVTASRTFGRSAANGKSGLKLYLAKFAVISAAALGAGLINAVISAALSAI